MMPETEQPQSGTPQTGSHRSSEVTISIEPVAAGQILDRLVIEEEIGRGGMGTVFRARHTTLDIDVAVKVLSPLIAVQQPAFAERFMREARLAAKIRHPNIVAVMDAIHDDEKQLYYIVQEFVDGGSALDLLDTGPLDELKAIDVTIGVVKALQQAEICNIVHRDIKPANIMLTREGVVKLADLGLARDMGDDGAGPTVSGSILGTPAYLSPEQAECVKDLDIRADIYSLGATFYHLLTGEPPFHGETTMNILRKLATREICLDPGKKRTSITPAVSAVCRKMMALTREERYSSCAELLTALETLTRGKLPPPCQSVHNRSLPEQVRDILLKRSFKQRMIAATGGILIVTSLLIWLVRKPSGTMRDGTPESQSELEALPPPEIGPIAERLPAESDTPPVSEPTPQPAKPIPEVKPKTVLTVPRSPTKTVLEPAVKEVAKKSALRSIPDANDLFNSAETLRKAMNPFKKEDRYREAERLYLKVLAKYPQSNNKEHCHYQLGNIYESYFYGKYKKAIEQYQAVLNLNPDTTYDVRWRIAVLYENRLGLRAEARKWYLESAELSKTPATRSEARVKAEQLKPDAP